MVALFGKSVVEGVHVVPVYRSTWPAVPGEAPSATPARPVTERTPVAVSVASPETDRIVGAALDAPTTICPSVAAPRDAIEPAVGV